jgi:Flp pilus assembly protein TadG
MEPVRTPSRARCCLRRLFCDRTGVSAIEFALVLPIMLTLYIGGVEVGDGFAISFKSTLAARTVTDLASQYISIDNSDMTNILGAASTVLTPYATSNVVVTLSEVTTNAQGVGKVVWSNSLNGTARVATTTVTLPAKLQTANITIMFGEVTYPYTPSLGYVLTGTINIYESFYFYPRMSTTIARVNS